MSYSSIIRGQGVLEAEASKFVFLFVGQQTRNLIVCSTSERKGSLNLGTDFVKDLKCQYLSNYDKSYLFHIVF